MRTYDRIDEDETVEVTMFGSPAREFMPIGLDSRLATVRADFEAGRIDLEEFEAETGRLLQKKLA